MARAVTLSGKNAQLGLGALALARISLGFVFLWAFVDKLLGLGFATCRNAASNMVDVGCSQAWLQGGSPTKGFLSFGTSGPFASLFQDLAGKDWADYLFMAGLLGIGVALTLGIATRLAVLFASVLLLLMWLAALWPANNPIIDDHIVYIFVLVAIAALDKNQLWGLGKKWRALPFVQKIPLLQ